MLKEVAGDILRTKAEMVAHGVAPNDSYANGLALADENCRRNPGGTERSLAQVGASCGFPSRVHASRSLLYLKIERRSRRTRRKHGVLL